MPSNKAFTVLELLVVIAIIGLLSSIVLISLNNAKDLARLAASRESSGMMNRVLSPYKQGEYIGTIQGTTVVDSSDAKNNIMGVTGYTNDPNGLSGTAFKSNSVDANQLGNGSIKETSGSITIEAWIKPDEILKCNFEVIGTEDSVIDYVLDINQGGYVWKALIYVDKAGVKTPCSIYAMPKLSIGKWNQLILSYDKSTGILKFYENDKQYEVSCGGPYSLFSIGTVNTGAGFIWCGGTPCACNYSLDELRIYDHSMDL